MPPIAPTSRAFQHLVFAVADPVVQVYAVRVIDKIRTQDFAGRAQRVGCVDVLRIFGIRQPPVIAQSGEKGAGGLSVHRRILILKAFEAHAYLECEGLASTMVAVGWKFWRVR